jgi:hypothetical protein
MLKFESNREYEVLLELIQGYKNNQEYIINEFNGFGGENTNNNTNLSFSIHLKYIKDSISVIFTDTGMINRNLSAVDDNYNLLG